jgi:phosphoglycolate phosphatase
VRSKGYEAVVYDLDGTLVRLAVDWTAAAEDVAAVYRDRGIDPGQRDLWDLLEQSTENGLHDAVEAALADHECSGARTSDRLGVADELGGLDVPVGVCSLNCEAACRIALDRHDLATHVEYVVGRDTVEHWKPDPQPLTATVEGLGTDPARALFVGDSRRDEVTAERAGLDFEYVARQ